MTRSDLKLALLGAGLSMVCPTPSQAVVCTNETRLVDSQGGPVEIHRLSATQMDTDGAPEIAYWVETNAHWGPGWIQNNSAGVLDLADPLRQGVSGSFKLLGTSDLDPGDGSETRGDLFFRTSYSNQRLFVAGFNGSSYDLGHLLCSEEVGPHLPCEPTNDTYGWFYANTQTVGEPRLSPVELGGISQLFYLTEFEVRHVPLTESALELPVAYYDLQTDSMVPPAPLPHVTLVNNAGFVEQPPYNNYYRLLQAGDFNGDGLGDLVALSSVYSAQSHSLHYWVGSSGPSGFQLLPAGVHPLGEYISQLQVGYLNDDACMDVAVVRDNLIGAARLVTVITQGCPAEGAPAPQQLTFAESRFSTGATGSGVALALGPIWGDTGCGGGVNPLTGNPTSFCQDVVMAIGSSKDNVFVFKNTTPGGGALSMVKELAINSAASVKHLHVTNLNADTCANPACGDILIGGSSSVYYLLQTPAGDLCE